MSDTTNNKRTIYVGNVGLNWEEKNLVQAFQCFGPIENVNFSSDDSYSNKGANEKKRYAFITFEEFVDATAAIDNMHENILYDRVLNVSLAKGNTRTYE